MLYSEYWGWCKMSDLKFLLITAIVLTTAFVWDYFEKKILTSRLKKRRKSRKTNETLGNQSATEKLNAANCLLKKYINERMELMDKKNLATPVTVILLLIVFIILCNPIAIVDVGERGVKVTLGKVSPQSYTEGIHLITPFISKIKTMDVKTQKKYISTDVYTKDIQQAQISYVVNFNLQPQNAHNMYREVGTGYVDTVLMPVVEGTIKDVIGKWNAQDLVANRESATVDILGKLQKQLQPRYINITGFQITDINYSGVFEKAIESKVTAEQDALKAKNRTVQIEEEAKQKIISAEAEAKSMAIRANALTRNKALVEYEAVQKWDGKLPQYMLGNTVPFLNLK